MEYFKEIFKSIISKIIIGSGDSDTEKAIKIIWYSIIGSIGILIFISWIIFILFTFSNENVKVPMVKGDDIYVALNKFYEKRLVVNARAAFNDDVEAGIVFRQSPNQGEIVKRGRLVTIYVSKGSVKAALPDFVGNTLFDLEERLKNEYPDGKIPFKIDNPVYEFNGAKEKGVIFKQEPDPNTPFHKIKKVKLWVSNGPEEKSAKILGNYLGKNIEEVSKELAKLELFYNCVFEIVEDRDKDMLVVDQSIEEGRMIDQIFEEGKVLILKVNKYLEVKGEKIKGTYLLDLPKKPLPFDVEVKVRDDAGKEKSILKLKTKGGVSLPVLYSANKDSKLVIYFENKVYKEVALSEEVLSGEKQVIQNE